MKERQGLCPVVRGCMYEGKTRVMSCCQRLYICMKERQGLCPVVRGCMYEGKTRVMSCCQRLYV